jgi:hypothetical protein
MVAEILLVDLVGGTDFIVDSVQIQTDRRNRRELVITPSLKGKGKGKSGLELMSSMASPSKSETNSIDKLLKS